MRKTLSEMVDTATAVVGKVVRGAVGGLVYGTQGAAEGMRDGWDKGSLSVAGRPGRAWAKGLAGGIQGAAKGIRDGWSATSQL